MVGITFGTNPFEIVGAKKRLRYCCKNGGPQLAIEADIDFSCEFEVVLTRQIGR